MGHHAPLSAHRRVQVALAGSLYPANRKGGSTIAVQLDFTTCPYCHKSSVAYDSFQSPPIWQCSNCLFGFQIITHIQPHIPKPSFLKRSTRFLGNVIGYALFTTVVLLILAAVLVSPQIYQTAKAYDFTREETAQYAYSLIPFVSDTSTASRNDLYQLLTDLTNNERKTARVHSVALGRNPAAQLHAEAALKGCYSGHWDRWGLKPNYRYTLAGGTGTGAENIFGSSYCVKSSDGFRSNSGLIAKQIQQGVQQWMNSPGPPQNFAGPSPHGPECRDCLRQLQPGDGPAV